MTSDGHAYTLTYEGDTVQAASDVAAGIHITTDTGAAAGAALQIEFDQQGSINGTAAVRIATDAAEGSYSLYWLNPDSLTIQSAGSGRIASGHAEISVRMGGRYWLSENVVRLDGNAADGSVEAVASGQRPDGNGSWGKWFFRILRRECRIRQIYRIGLRKPADIRKPEYCRFGRQFFGIIRTDCDGRGYGRDHEPGRTGKAFRETGAGICGRQEN